MRVMRQLLPTILVVIGVALVSPALAQQHDFELTYDPPLNFEHPHNQPLVNSTHDDYAELDPSKIFLDLNNVAAPNYDPVACRNGLVPFVYNDSLPWPNNKVPWRQAIRVLTGETLKMAFMLNTSPNASISPCPMAFIGLSAFNPKATEIYFSDAPQAPYQLMYLGQYINVTIVGKLIGYSAVKVNVYNPAAPQNGSIYEDCDGKLMATCRFIAVAYFVPTVADQVYDIITIVFTVLCQMDIGLRTKWTHVMGMIKNPVPAIIGLSCHFIMMPLLAFAMAKIIDTGSPELAMGFFLSCIVSGSGLSNLHTQVLGGDFQLSVVMTYLSQVLALGFTPMWIAIFEPLIVPPGIDTTVPFDKIVSIIAQMLAPAIVAFIFRHFLPKWGHFLQKFVTFPIIALLFLYYCTYGLYTYQWMFQLFTPAVVLCGCLLPYMGFILSGVIALAARQPMAHVVTIMMETSFQHVGIALSILQLSISDKIIATLSLVGPYSVMIFGQVPVVLVELIYFAKTRCWPRIKQQMDARNKHKRLGDDDEEVLDPAAYSEGGLSAGTNPISGSQFDAASSAGMSTSDETRRFFERKKDYFGNNLVK